MIIEQCQGLEGLPFDCFGAAQSFRPYAFRLERIMGFLRANALQLIGLVLAIAVMI